MFQCKAGINSIELLDKNIEISDANGTSGPIELLIGADIAGTIYTGKSFQLNNGLLAMET
ncbi:hypothetical protein NQ315_003283 [Exocentrus adspersus]|uniref:Uncharacterized protein n=1 Tax=Exocentrus adspersus TaxID=1586481 RepID=A0AAV8VCG4_9CUCU|nr:hypothetical protein NQ315_003283 [Exocentrus adspersus]